MFTLHNCLHARLTKHCNVPASVSMVSRAGTCTLTYKTNFDISYICKYCVG